MQIGTPGNPHSTIREEFTDYQYSKIFQAFQKSKEKLVEKESDEKEPKPSSSDE